MSKLTGYKKVASIVQGSYSPNQFWFAVYDDDIKIGDSVIVTGQSSGKIWKVFNIVEPDDPCLPASITAEIICKVDCSAYEARCKQRKEVDNLNKKLKARKKQLAETKLDDYYASIDPEYAEILAEIKKIEGDD